MAVQSNIGLFLPIWASSIILNHMNSTKRRRLAICSSNIDWNKKKGGGGGVPNSNYVVPLDKSLSSITRPLAEIFRDLNKRIPDNIVKTQSQSESFRDLNNNVKTQSQSQSQSSSPSIPWYHANRMLSFYAPAKQFNLCNTTLNSLLSSDYHDSMPFLTGSRWCGEIRDVIFSDNGSVTVVYRVTVRGSDGEAHRESSATISSTDAHIVDPVAAAEEIAFCRACARFGLGLYLYHEE